MAVVRIWVLLSTLVVGGGWILSAFHQLNRLGYGIVFALALAAALFCRPITGWGGAAKLARSGNRLLMRCKRPAPLLFFGLAILSLLAGLWYVPTNADSNGYRIPRVLHWLAEGRWHWIHTFDERMNIANCGFEWLSAPLMLFTHTDRLVFLINWISFLLLPGLIFSVFTRLQVRPRVAWWWMWFLPAGWCFVFQAASTVNDSFAAIYALAAVAFALRAQKNDRLTDLWFSILAVALLTGTKQTAMPLALLWLIALWPGRRWLWSRPLATGAVVMVALLVSAVPTMLFNHAYTGTWSGIPLVNGPDSPFWRTQPLPSPLWGIIGNAFCLPVQNLEPPFFPWNQQWNAAMQHFLQTPFGAHFTAFEKFGALRPGISEATAGIGLGVCLLTVISLFAAHHYADKARAGVTLKINRRLWWLRLAPWLLLILFMAKIGTSQNARQFAPYYIFLFPALLVRPGHTLLAGKRWWQQTGVWVMLFSLALLVVARNRPLFPARLMVTQLQKKYPAAKFLAKASFLYSNELSVENMRNHLPQALPPGEPVIGYAAVFGRSEPWLWLPFGQRRLEHVLPEDTPAQLFAKGIHFVVMEDSALSHEHQTIQQWADKFDGELIDRWTFEKDLNAPPGELFLVRLHPPTGR